MKLFLIIVGILIACIIVAILFFSSNSVIPQVKSNSDKAKVLKARMDIKNIINILEMFKLENNAYPTTNEGLKALVANPDSEKYKNWRQYMREQRSDPWGNEYQYSLSDPQGKIDVYSLGQDGIKSEDDVRNN